jgi:class 3 adenylate cyclase/CheY-like chemotaxis protein
MAAIGKSIFVVDDDVFHAQALGQLLAAEGYAVKTFESAEQVLAARDELKTCDLIISDINMPGENGYELCRRLRNETSYGRIPFILITGSDPGAERAEGIDAGADDFIGKPCRMPELLAKIRSLLQIRSKELATLEELSSTKVLNSRLSELQRFLSPNIVNRLTEKDIEPLLKPHRAEVTVLFVDLRGFTSFSERREPEEVLDVLGAYYTAVGNAAIKYKGTLGHLAGDGIMVFFNDPEPIPNHQEEALRMAIEARESLVEQRRLWQQRQYGIDFGMGLSAGFATIGAIGFERFSQYSVIGPVTNFAARMCSVATGGQILVSQRFLARVADLGFNFESLGEREVKGLDRSVSVYNVT